MASIHTVKWTLKNGETRSAYRVSYWLNGKKTFRQFAVKRKAHQFVETLHLHRGEQLARESDRRRITFAEGVALYIADCKTRLRPDTVDWYESVLRNHLLDRMGTRTIGLGERDRLREVVRDCGLAKARTVVQVFLRWLVEEELAPEGLHLGRVRHGVRKARRDGSARGLKVPTPADVMKLLDIAATLAAKTQRWQKWSLLLQVLVFTGMRISEVRALTWGAVDIVKQTAEVRQSADKSGRFHPCKTETSHRTIDIPEQLCAVLEVYRDLVKPSSKDDLLFGTRSNTAVQMKTLRRNFLAPLEREFGHKVRLHGFRHYYASRLIQSGFNPLEVSRLLGHSNPAFTMKVYAHLFDDHQSRADRLRRINLLPDQLRDQLRDANPRTPGSAARRPASSPGT